MTALTKSRECVSVDFSKGIICSSPKTGDAPLIARMVRDSRSLDVNSDYAYLVLCTHFSETCVIARCNQDAAGFVLAYIPPNEPQTLFIWQIYVKPIYRRTGLGFFMIESLLNRLSRRGVRYVEATINPSNKPSEKLFRIISKKLNAKCETSLLFKKDLFLSDNHEDEVLFRIGPLTPSGG